MYYSLQYNIYNVQYRQVIGRPDARRTRALQPKGQRPPLCWAIAAEVRLVDRSIIPGHRFAVLVYHRGATGKGTRDRSSPHGGLIRTTITLTERGHRIRHKQTQAHTQTRHLLPHPSIRLATFIPGRRAPIPPACPKVRLLD